MSKFGVPIVNLVDVNSDVGKNDKKDSSSKKDNE